MIHLFEALVIATALACGGLAYRAFWQYRNARTFAIRTDNGIDEASFIQIGGIEQWIQIRGENRSNPVMLVLHGGMALSYLAFTPLFQPWEKQFTIVQWDRRGVGKTFGRNHPNGHGEMDLERIILDGIELAEWLGKRLQKEKLILLGHSMGSIVGLTMAKRRPNLFLAYLGTEQVISMAENEAVSYELMLATLRAVGDEKSLDALTQIGPPPYPNVRVWGAKQQLMTRVDPMYRRTVRRVIPSLLFFAPNYSLKDLLHFIAGNRFSAEHLFADWMSFDAKKLGHRFEIPVLIIQGETDVMAPTVLVQEWFEQLEAQQKSLVVVNSMGHLLMFVNPDLFLCKLANFLAANRLGT
jgi:pimeloyl-ACP methyl ester carboxylesterase